jgi:hypothetical protein
LTVEKEPISEVSPAAVEAGVDVAVQECGKSRISVGIVIDWPLVRNAALGLLDGTNARL